MMMMRRRWSIVVVKSLTHCRGHVNNTTSNGDQLLVILCWYCSSCYCTVCRCGQPIRGALSLEHKKFVGNSPPRDDRHSNAHDIKSSFTARPQWERTVICSSTTTGWPDRSKRRNITEMTDEARRMILFCAVMSVWKIYVPIVEKPVAEPLTN